ncbi:MAG: AAA family ATPase [Anaerolineae bacterium]
MDLFEHSRQEQIQREAPLAARMRPRTLAELVGQEHIVGEGRLLRRAIQADRLSSLIFWGPAGTGKTTLASIIANTTASHFAALSAVLAGVADLRQIIAEARERRNLYGRRTILLIDEIHRWNKAQQDAMLPHVEDGTVILIGATTENPYFSVIAPLVSRSRIFQLEPLSQDDLRVILQRALDDPERGYGKLKVDVADEAMAHIVNMAGGDARNALNALELAIETTLPDDDGVIHIGLAVAEESIQRRALRYDRGGDEHYDTISAFIKSIRGSDPDAALYWLAKMIYAGEDPRFIARRLVVHASEDIGLADPMALVVATAAAHAVEYVGMPEARLNLAEATLYLATAPKSNSVLSIMQALEDVEREGEIEVPDHLKDASRDAEGLGHGQGYRYPHDFAGHHVAQQYLPRALQGRRWYKPGDEGYEREIAERLAKWRAAQSQASPETRD